MTTTTSAILTAAGGLFGAAGVALSAVAAHAGGANLDAAALFLLVHAPALLAIGLAGRGRLMALAGAILLCGAVLFCGDLVLRDLYGQRLFPMAAPTGGTLMIGGWLVAAVAAFAARAKP